MCLRTKNNDEDATNFELGEGDRPPTLSMTMDGLIPMQCYDQEVQVTRKEDPEHDTDEVEMADDSGLRSIEFLPGSTCLGEPRHQTEKI